jgi:phage tail-like protein
MATAVPAWMKGSPAFEADAPPAEMPVAFAFKVEFLNLPSQSGALQCSFKEVSGLQQSLETEDVPEGGENRFVHQLPTRAKPGRLVLKRGLIERGSALMEWCSDVLTGGLDQRIQPADVKVQLFDAENLPLMVWTCNAAYPVRWTLDSFESTKNEAAIEEIELAYRNCVSTT